jgi:hypothetical protein
MKGDLDAAGSKLRAVLNLDPVFRIATITGYLADMDSLLARRRFANDPKAGDLRELIRVFTAAACPAVEHERQAPVESTPRGLPSLHAHAESVLQLIERGEPALLEGYVPQLRQRAQEHLVLAASEARRLGQRVGLLLFAHDHLSHRPKLATKPVPQDRPFEHASCSATADSARRPLSAGP